MRKPRRTLVEALTDLICFRRTNEDDYRHVLVLKDLKRVRGTQQDLDLFYAYPSLNVAAQVQRLADEAARARVLSRCLGTGSAP